MTIEKIDLTPNDALPTIDVLKIMSMIPHRYPFLMVDRIQNIILHKTAVGVKNVTINEPLFEGHFPGHPVFPGVMLIEAMAQTAASLVVYSLGDEAKNKLVYFMSLDETRFRHPVRPGDQVLLPVSIERSRGKVWKFKGEAYVDGKLCAEATFSAMIMDP
jgi:3-hydroxyacyl-[acyl-carrier-protein] dehydratase